MDHNYNERIKEFIITQLIPMAVQQKDYQLSLYDIYGLVVNVLPKKWIDPTDVYNVLLEIGHKPIIDKTKDGDLISFYKFK